MKKIIISFVSIFLGLVLLILLPSLAGTLNTSNLQAAAQYWVSQGYVAYADALGNLIPFSGDNLSDLGSSTASWRNAYIDGILYGKTGRTATIIVAASDSSALLKAQADYIVSGAAEDEIQAAITAAAGGEIYLASGNYAKSNVPAITIPSNTTVRLSSGALITQADIGGSSTERVFTNSTPTSNNTNITIIGGKITGTTQWILHFDNVTNLKICDMDLSGDQATAIKILNSSDIEINGNYFHDGTRGFYISESTRGLINNNRFYNMGWGAGEVSTMTAYPGCTYFTIVGNVVDTCIHTGFEVVHSNYVIVTGNTLRNCGDTAGIELISDGTYAGITCIQNAVLGNTIYGGTGPGIYISYGDRNSISGNTIHGTTGKGIYSESGNKLVISNNIVYEVGGQGIEVIGAECLVTGNYISDASKGNSNSYNGIALTATNITVSNNLIRKGVSADAWVGIRVRSGSNSVTVVDNDLRYSGNSAGLNDAGTNTVIARNQGWVTENSGTTTILSGNIAVVVTHGLVGTPTLINLTGTQSEVKDCIATSVGDTYFTITASANVTSNRSVYWRATVGAGN